MNNLLINSNSKFVKNLLKSLGISCTIIATASCSNNNVNKINRGSEKGDGDKKEVDGIKYDEDPILSLGEKGDEVEHDGSKDNGKDDFGDGVEKCQIDKNDEDQKLGDLIVTLQKLIDQRKEKSKSDLKNWKLEDFFTKLGEIEKIYDKGEDDKEVYRFDIGTITGKIICSEQNLILLNESGNEISKLERKIQEEKASNQKEKIYSNDMLKIKFLEYNFEEN